MSIAEQDQRGFPEPPVEDWGDGPAAYEPGQRPSRPGDRTPPQDNAAEQSVLGAMLLSKDAIADVSEIVRGVPGVSCTAAPQVGAQETGGSSTGASKFSPGWLAAWG